MPSPISRLVCLRFNRMLTANAAKGNITSVTWGSVPKVMWRNSEGFPRKRATSIEIVQRTGARPTSITARAAWSSRT